MDEAVLSNKVAFSSADHEQAAAEPRGIPWITYTVIFLCTMLWAYLNFGEDWPYYGDVLYTVAPPGFRIWTGAVWGLVTAAFVHFDFWHILFNMWWTKDFGRVLEPGMGQKKYLLFILCAAVISSGLQLLFTDQTGIGFSGVVYAMFGFGVVVRRVHPQYHEIVDTRTVQWLLGWLVLCIILTYFDVLSIANAAHVGGLLFGLCVGMIFVVRRYVTSCSILLVLLAAMTMVSVTYLPWSEGWRSRHEIIEIIKTEEKARAGDPEAQYVYSNILMSYEEERAEGISWLRKSAEQGYLPAMNGVAWMLATDPASAVRNGTEAIELALQVCEKDEWKTAGYIDTLAAAYAEADKWDEAIATQQQAIEQLADEDDSMKTRVRARLQSYQQHEKTRGSGVR